jgi:hypothetical protein
LVFYVRWQEYFPNPSTLLRDFDVGYCLLASLVPRIVQSGVREEARQAVIVIDLISDPLWR